MYFAAKLSWDCWAVFFARGEVRTNKPRDDTSVAGLVSAVLLLLDEIAVGNNSQTLWRCSTGQRGIPESNEVLHGARTIRASRRFLQKLLSFNPDFVELTQQMILGIHRISIVILLRICCVFVEKCPPCFHWFPLSFMTPNIRGMSVEVQLNFALIFCRGFYECSLCFC